MWLQDATSCHKKKKKKENPSNVLFVGKLLKERVAQNDFDYSKVYAYSIFIC